MNNLKKKLKPIQFSRIKDIDMINEVKKKAARIKEIADNLPDDANVQEATKAIAELCKISFADELYQLGFAIDKYFEHKENQLK